MLDDISSKNALDLISKKRHYVREASRIVIILVILLVGVTERELVLVLSHEIVLLLLLLTIHIARNIRKHITIGDILSSVGSKTTRLRVIVVHKTVVFIAIFP